MPLHFVRAFVPYRFVGAFMPYCNVGAFVPYHFVGASVPYRIVGASMPHCFVEAFMLTVLQEPLCLTVLQILPEPVVLVELFYFCWSFKSYHTAKGIFYHFISLYVIYIHVYMNCGNAFYLAFTHRLCITHYSFNSFFQILFKSVLHLSLLLRSCYLSVDAMSHFHEVSWYHDGDIIVRSSRSVIGIYFDCVGQGNRVL